MIFPTKPVRFLWSSNLEGFPIDQPPTVDISIPQLFPATYAVHHNHVPVLSFTIQALLLGGNTQVYHIHGHIHWWFFHLFFPEMELSQK